VPVMYDGDTVLIATGGAAAPVRFGVIVPETPAATTQASTAPSTEKSTATSPSTQKADSGKRGWTIAPPGYELRLRMSGLLWPEAADRLAHTAYMTRERVGAGQVILFASSPTFRAAALGTTRILANALVCGPGMGAEQTIKP